MSKKWYVQATEPRPQMDTFGPFDNEADARAYAMDLANEPEADWGKVEAKQLTDAEVEEQAMGPIIWPYQDGEES